MKPLRSLDEAGLDVADIRPILASGLDENPRARQVADSLLTHPTHPYVTPRDIDEMARRTRDIFS